METGSDRRRSPPVLERVRQSIVRAPALVVIAILLALTCAVAVGIILTVRERLQPPQPAAAAAAAVLPSEATTMTVAEAASFIADRAMVFDGNSFVSVNSISSSSPPRFAVDVHGLRLLIGGPKGSPFVSGRYWIQEAAPLNGSDGGTVIAWPMYPVTISLPAEFRSSQNTRLWMNLVYGVA